MSHDNLIGNATLPCAPATFPDSDMIVVCLMNHLSNHELASVGGGVSLVALPFPPTHLQATSTAFRIACVWNPTSETYCREPYCHRSLCMYASSSTSWWLLSCPRSFWPAACTEPRGADPKAVELVGEVHDEAEHERLLDRSTGDVQLFFTSIGEITGIG